MREFTSRESIRKLTDDLSDTKSWADLAKELDKYVAKSKPAENFDTGTTLNMADLLKSLEDGGAQSDESPGDESQDEKDKT